MVDKKEFLRNTFNENQNLSEFKVIVGLMKEYNIKLGITHDSKHGPAYLSYALDPINNKLGDGRVVVNTYHELDPVKTALDHELTHVGQVIIMQKMGTAGANKNIKSLIGYTLLAESHAFSNQAGFAVKRYMKKVSMGQTRNTPEQKTIESLAQRNLNTGPIVKGYVDALKAYIPASKKHLG